jgi:hypothetical protein
VTSSSERPVTIAEPSAAGRKLRTPKSAALAGIAFSVLFGIVLVLARLAVPSDPSDAGEWLTDDTRRGAVLFALGLVPFVGIAFLWFVGVLRDRIGDSEDRFFSTVFLGSGLLFVGALFVAAAVAAGLVASVGDDPGGLLSSETWTVGRRTTHELMVVYAIRMAAVFTIASSTILMRTRLAPRALVASGYAIGAALLLTVGFFPWIELAFPAWVFAVSVYILVAERERALPVDAGEIEEAQVRGV